MERRSRHAIGTLGAVLLALLVAGCWPVPGQGPDRRAYNPVEEAIGVDTAASLRQLWAATLDGGPAGDPVLSRRAVHVDSDRAAYGLVPETGDRRWTHTQPAPLSVLGPLVPGREILISRRDDTASASSTAVDDTIARDAETGDDERPVVAGQAVALRNNRVLSWDVSRFQGRTGPAYWAASLVLQDLGSGARVCCDGFYNLYSASPPPPAPPPLTLGSDFIFAAGQGVIDPAGPSFGNGVRGISIASPESCFGLYVCPTWAVALDGTTSTAPVLGDDEAVVYVGTDAGTMYAVDPATATIRWSQSVGSAVTDSPALVGDTLYVPTRSGALVALNAATGATRWAGSTGAGNAIAQQPAVAGGVVFTGSADGTIAAFDAAGCGGAILCSRLWTRSVGSEITGAPAVGDGRLYVGTADGRLVAFGL